MVMFNETYLQKQKQIELCEKLGEALGNPNIFNKILADTQKPVIVIVTRAGVNNLACHTEDDRLKWDMCVKPGCGCSFIAPENPDDRQEVLDPIYEISRPVTFRVFNKNQVEFTSTPRGTSHLQALLEFLKRGK